MAATAASSRVRRAAAGRSARLSKAPRIGACALPYAGGEGDQRLGCQRHILATEDLERDVGFIACHERLADTAAHPLAQNDGVEQRQVGGPDQRGQVRVDQCRRILDDGAGDDLAVLQQRQENRARRLARVQQAVGQRGADLHGRIVEKADQRGIERGVLLAGPSWSR